MPNPYCWCGHMNRNHGEDGFGPCAAGGCGCKQFNNNEVKILEEPESTIVKRAKEELALINPPDDEFPGFTEKVIEIVEIFASMGHSGSSAEYTRRVISDLLAQRPLAPITDDPAEWQKHEPDVWDGKNAVWQNRRDSRLFSTDGGVSYWNIDDVKASSEIRMVKSKQSVNGPNGDYIRRKSVYADAAPYDR